MLKARFVLMIKIVYCFV